jgi:hypothetical protein
LEKLKKKDLYQKAVNDGLETLELFATSHPAPPQAEEISEPVTPADSQAEAVEEPKKAEIVEEPIVAEESVALEN